MSLPSNKGLECATERIEATTDLTDLIQWSLLKTSVSGDDLSTLRVASGTASAADSACASATLLELCDAMTTNAQTSRQALPGSAHFTTPSQTAKELSDDDRGASLRSGRDESPTMFVQGRLRPVESVRPDECTRLGSSGVIT